MTPDAWFHLFELLFDFIVLAPIAWKAMRALNRVLDVLKDFPPHRHANGKIFFPAGMSPGRSEVMETEPH